MSRSSLLRNCINNTKLFYHSLFHSFYSFDYLADKTYPISCNTINYSTKANIHYYFLILLVTVTQ